MTFVTKVPCAQVIGTRLSLFFYSDRSLLHARKGQWRQNSAGWNSDAIYPYEHIAF